MPTKDITEKINELRAEIEEVRKLPERSFDFSDEPTSEDGVQIMDPISAAAYQLIADHATDMISVHSVDGRYVFVSSACRRLLGFGPGELMGVNPYDLFHPDDAERITEHHVKNLVSTEAPPITYRLRCKNGTYRWVETTSRTHVSHAGTKKIIAITRDVSERERLVRQLEEANRRLMDIASRDELTGVANRRAFNERLSYLVLDSNRGRRFSLVVGDIDNFKKLNDTYGHQAGDDVISMVARALVGECRSVDMVARYGGEEFAILLPGTDLEGALVLAERARSAIATMMCQYGPVTMSFGVCSSSPENDSEQAVFSMADRALYVAKSNGRNRVEAHTSE